MAKKVSKTTEKRSFADLKKDLAKKYGEDLDILTEESGTVESFRTGSLLFDNLLGCKGIPKGRLIEIIGEYSSGKTLVSLFIAAQIQRDGGNVAFIDVECSYNEEYTKGLGVDTSKLFVAQPADLETTMELVRDLIETGEFDLIIVDSVAAMSPKYETQVENFGKDTMGLMARKLGPALRIITKPAAKNKTTIIFINQIREMIGVMFGSNKTSPGGKALKFFSSVRLEVSKGEKFLDKDGAQIGNILKINAVKNKVGKPFSKTEVAIYYGVGIDLVHDTFNFGLNEGLIVKTGNTYSYKEEKLGVGANNVVHFLTSNKELHSKIREEFDQYLKTKVVTTLFPNDQQDHETEEEGDEEGDEGEE